MKNRMRKPKNWISEALSGGKNKGALKRTALKKGLLSSKDEKLSMSDLHKLEKIKGTTSKRAYMAETLRKFDDGGELRQYRYLNLKEVDDGMELSLNEEGMIEAESLREEGKLHDDAIINELFDDVRGNSELMFFDDAGEAGLGLSSAPVITDGYYYDDNGELQNHDDARLFVFGAYATVSPLEMMLQEGKVIFGEVMSNGGGIGSISNNYQNKSASQVWVEWDYNQKKHFLLDHTEIYKESAIENVARQDFENLGDDIKNAIIGHVESKLGQYKKGGSVWDAKVIVISPKHPMYKQLTELGVDSFTQVEDGNPFVLKDDITEKIIVGFTLSYLGNVDEKVIDENLSYVKGKYNVSGFDWVRKPIYENGGGVTFLPPMVVINMDNYKPYSSIDELRGKSITHLKSLREQEFSLEESNPDIKFNISSEGIIHLTRKSGLHKLLITKHLPEIFKQAIITGVENETKGDKNVEHIIKCSTYIMMENKVYVFYFILKMKKGGDVYFYDGSIDVNLPEKEKTT